MTHPTEYAVLHANLSTPLRIPLHRTLSVGIRPMKLGLLSSRRPREIVPLDGGPTGRSQATRAPSVRDCVTLAGPFVRRTMSPESIPEAIGR